MSAPSAGNDGAYHGERGGIGARGRREHPGGAGEQVDARAVEPFLLGSRHRVTADEAARELGTRRLHFGHHRRLHRADVGDERHAGVERFDHDLADLGRPAPRPPRGRRRVRRRATPDAKVSIAPISLARAARSGCGSYARDFRTGAPQREADRPADQAGADERDATAGVPCACRATAREIGAKGGRALEEHVAAARSRGRSV